MKIYVLECLTEDGLIENNGYFINKSNAEKSKKELDNESRNIKYGISQHLIEIETED